MSQPYQQPYQQYPGPQYGQQPPKSSHMALIIGIVVVLVILLIGGYYYMFILYKEVYLVSGKAANPGDSGYVFSYDEGAKLCKELGGTMATRTQSDEAGKAGQSFTKSGWILDDPAKPGEHNCLVWTPPYMTAGVYCYGIRPAKTESVAAIPAGVKPVVTTPLPTTKYEITPFSATKWSQYE